MPALPHAGRAAARLTARLARQQQRQPFSIMHSLRTLARSFEAHPFERLPASARPAPADWGRLVRRTGGNAVYYFPILFGLLGWPYAARLMLDEKI